MSYPLRQEYLISYDVEDGRIRTRIFKELSKHGLNPVQKSVFWGYLTLAELEAIKRYLNASLENKDKGFITHTNFNGRGQFVRRDPAFRLKTVSSHIPILTAGDRVI